MKQTVEPNIDQIIADVQKMFVDKAERDKQRQASNLAIVELLKEFFLANPYTRFEQAIYVLLNGDLKFTQESVDTLKKFQDFKQRNKNKF